MYEPVEVKFVLLITSAPVLLSAEYTYTVSLPRLFILEISLIILFPVTPVFPSLINPNELSPIVKVLPEFALIVWPLPFV